MRPYFRVWVDRNRLWACPFCVFAIVDWREGGSLYWLAMPWYSRFGKILSRPFFDGSIFNPFFVLGRLAYGFPCPCAPAHALFRFPVSQPPCVSVVCPKYTTTAARGRSEYGGGKMAANRRECGKIAHKPRSAPEIIRKMRRQRKRGREMRTEIRKSRTGKIRYGLEKRQNNIPL